MTQPNQTNQFVEDEINLRDYWRVLVRRRRLVLGITCVAAVVTAIFVLLQPNIYRSTATLMPLGKSAGGLRGALGGLSGLLPMNLSALESPAKRILAILKSRTLAEDVVQRLDLPSRLLAGKRGTGRKQREVDKPLTVRAAARMLSGLVSISTERSGIITIAIEHTDRELVATIANQYLDSLQRILNENAFSLAKKNRLFIDAQLQKTKRDLIVAEETLRQFEQAHGIIALDAQAKAAVEAIATLQGKIMAKEVHLKVLSRTVTGVSREVTLMQEELKGLRSQLARLQYGTSVQRHVPRGKARNAPSFLAAEDAPEIKLQYARLQREVMIQNKLFTLLIQQLEQARIEEAKDETAFQVLDRAIPPDTRSKPNRRLTVVLATIAATFLGILVAFFREYSDPDIRTREQVERRVGVPVLATIPLALPTLRRRWWRRAQTSEATLVLHQPLDSPLVEYYRYLHTCLKQINGGRGIRTMLLTHAGSDDRIMTVGANLAVVAANLGVRTLLVDCNIRHPSLHRMLDCPLAPGLADMLSNPDEWEKGVQSTMIDDLYLIPTGTASPTAFASFDSPAFNTLIARFKETYDLVLFSASSMHSLTNVAILGSKVDVSCLAISSGDSRIEAVTKAKTSLEAVQARIIGAVLVVKTFPGGKEEN